MFTILKMKQQMLFSKTALQQAQNLNKFLLSTRKNFSVSSASPRKKSAACCSKNKSPALRIVVPKNCEKPEPPIMTPSCKIAAVVGGSDNGFGYWAADQLLYHGAKKVILADRNIEAGTLSEEKLCKLYGNGRAKLYPCELKNSCQVEGIFKMCRCLGEHISIMVNDLDSIQAIPDSCLNYCDDAVPISNTMRLSRLGIEMMSCKKNSDASRSVIINCASILGFMGWPDEPEPVYCYLEPAVQTTKDLTKSFPYEETGVRLVSICTTNRGFDSIGLPDLPDESTQERNRITCIPKSCLPDLSKDRNRIGTAMVQVMARAEPGSTWLIDPPYSLRVMPRLVHFPQEGKPIPPDYLVQCPGGFAVGEKKSDGGSCECESTLKGTCKS